MLLLVIGIAYLYIHHVVVVVGGGGGIIPVAIDVRLSLLRFLFHCHNSHPTSHTEPI